MTPHYTQKRSKDGSAFRIPYYCCTKTMHFDNSVCSVKHVNADHVEGLVVVKLAELSQDGTYLKESIDELNRDLQRKMEPLEREAQQIRKRLAEIEDEIGHYVKALGQGKLSIARLEEQIGTLEADKKALQIELFECERKSTSPGCVITIRKSCTALCRTFGWLSRRWPQRSSRKPCNVSSKQWSSTPAS
jgi:septal ring factor EnvC (AmiA/AmiB activator)